MRITPKIGSTGLYQFKDPFVTTSFEYTCVKIENVKELVNDGINVYELYYLSNNLTEAIYLSDLQEDVALITLVAKNKVDLVIPDTYILQVPLNDIVPYHRLVVSVDLGVLPKSVTITNLINELLESSESMIGQPVVVSQHTIPITQTYTENESLIMENTRKNNIVKLQSKLSLKLYYENIIKILKERIKNLESLVISLTP